MKFSISRFTWRRFESDWCQSTLAFLVVLRTKFQVDVSTEDNASLGCLSDHFVQFTASRISRTAVTVGLKVPERRRSLISTTVHVEHATCLRQAALLPKVLTLGVVLEVSGNSMYIAKLCKGRTCNDLKFPILDYDAATKTCVCTAHPCWNDNGLQHKCPGEKHDDAWRELPCAAHHLALGIFIMPENERERERK